MSRYDEMSECSFRQNRKGGVEEDKLLAIRGVLSPGVLVSWCPGVLVSLAPKDPKRPKKTQRLRLTLDTPPITANSARTLLDNGLRLAGGGYRAVLGRPYSATANHKYPQVPRAPAPRMHLLTSVDRLAGPVTGRLY